MAEKKQIMEMTRILLGLEKIPRPDDAADALALAICQGTVQAPCFPITDFSKFESSHKKKVHERTPETRTEDPKNEQNTQNTEKHT